MKYSGFLCYLGFLLYKPVCRERLTKTHYARCSCSGYCRSVHGLEMLSSFEFDAIFLLDWKPVSAGEPNTH